MRLRERHQLTQGELADQVGLTQTTLSRIERGQARPDPFVLRRLAETFNMTNAEFSQSVDMAFQRTQQAAQSSVRTESEQTWWQVALGVAGLAGLIGLATFAVAAVVSELEAETKRQARVRPRAPRHRPPYGGRGGKRG